MLAVRPFLGGDIAPHAAPGPAQVHQTQWSSNILDQGTEFPNAEFAVQDPTEVMTLEHFKGLSVEKRKNAVYLMPSQSSDGALKWKVLTFQKNGRVKEATK
jgi:hypothetical protein